MNQDFKQEHHIKTSKVLLIQRRPAHGQPVTVLFPDFVYSKNYPRSAVGPHTTMGINIASYNPHVKPTYTYP